MFGAKITGGGSGGTVAILGRPEAQADVERIARDHAARFGGGRMASGSSAGAMAVPVVVVDPPSR